MNLQLAHKLIAEAERRPSEFLKITGREEAREVREMAEAGLVKAAGLDDLNPTEAVITQVTHAGHHFYRALKNVRSFANN